MRQVERNVLDVIQRFGIVDGETLDRHLYNGNSDQRNYWMRKLVDGTFVESYKLDDKRKYWVLGSAGEALCNTKCRRRNRDYSGDELRKRFGMLRFCFDRDEPFVLLKADEFAAEFPELVQGIETVRSHYFFEVVAGGPRRLGHLIVDTQNPREHLLKRVGEAIDKRRSNEHFRTLVRERIFFCLIVTGDVGKAKSIAEEAEERKANRRLDVDVETHVIADLYDVGH